MLQICRTCLEEITDCSFLTLNTRANQIMIKLSTCVPEMDLSLTPNAVICTYCANSLHAAYDFKQKCLESEEKIRSHKVDQISLDLVQIKWQPELDEKFDIVESNGIGMEVIFIKDDEVEKAECPRAEVDEHVNPFLISSSDNESNSSWFEESVKKLPHNTVKPNGAKNSTPKQSLKSTKKKLARRSSESTNDSGPSKQKNGSMNNFNGSQHFKCELCTRSFVDEEIFKKHMETHGNDKRYYCLKCDFYTSVKVALWNHSKKCNSLNVAGNKKILKPEKAFKCTKCSFQTYQKESLEKHMNTHSNDNLKCTKCPFEVANLSTFKRHLSTHTIGKSCKCKICHFECYNVVALNKHMINHKSKMQNSKTAIVKHALTKSGQKHFACTECDYKSTQKQNLLTHMKHHQPKSGPYKCTTCSYSAQGAIQIKVHMKKFHKAKKQDSKKSS